MKQIIGYAMLATPIVAMLVVLAMELGLLHVAGIVGLVAWIVIATELVMS